MATSVRIISAAPTSSITDSATSAMTRPLLTIAWRLPPVTDLAPSFSDSVRSMDEPCHAGARPKIRAVAIDTATVNARTAPLMTISDSSGMVSGGTSAMMALRPR